MRGKSQSQGICRGYQHPETGFAAMYIDLQWAYPWRITTASCLHIANIYMAIFDPTRPPVGVDASLFQDQRPCMPGG
jgi:hypothetical protein